MDEYSSVDTITPTIGGFWIGVIGAVVGVAGLGFSIYSSVEKEPNVRLLILSGWTAALLASVTAGIIAFRLVRLISGMSQKIAALSSRLSELQADKRFSPRKRVRLSPHQYANELLRELQLLSVAPRTTRGGPWI
nr:hypothetical protein [uncultured Cupriavidus sp.]